MSASEAAVGEAKPGLLERYLPILDWLPTYQRGWFAPDAVAALSVWALLIPQGLAYASIAGVPVQYGLYTAFVAVIAYAIFGTSRQLAQGPSGAVAAVSAAVVGPIVGAAALGTERPSATPPPSPSPPDSCTCCSGCCGWAGSRPSCQRRCWAASSSASPSASSSTSPTSCSGSMRSPAPTSRS